ncbi:MAG: hypothetical protein J0H02_03090 [Armatimonadetes bacterium]|nr:hypothetical protein [Armatimonadota bacterium]
MTLAISNIYMQGRDRSLALGPKGEAQASFFENAPDRPDIAAFYKKLSPRDKLIAAKNLGKYDAPWTIRLAAIWLADFDPDARKELTSVMIRLAESQPKAVVAELKNTGGFQKLAVFQALKKRGSEVYPLVVDALDSTDTRANAIDLLVEMGVGSAPLILPKLQSTDKDVRLAAADALGKLAYTQAGPAVLNQFKKAPEDQKLAFLAALANLGWPGAEPTLAGIFKDETAPLTFRSAAALGLGRIGDRTSVQLLSTEARTDSALHNDAVAALQATGDAGVLASGLSPVVRLEVAAGVKTPVADNVIKSALSDPRLEIPAAIAASGRERLIEPLVAVLSSLDPQTDGKRIAAILNSLGSTEAGRYAIAHLDAPRLRGFVERTQALANP